MRSRLGHKLRRVFSTRMQQVLPNYQQIPPSESPFGGDRIFIRQLDTHDFHFILLQLAPNRDDFTIELAWNTEPSFPSSLMSMFIEETAQHQPESGRIRLGTLMPVAKDHWWSLAWETPVWELSEEQILNPNLDLDADLPKAIEGVECVVEDAAKALVEYGIPFLESVSHRI